jgi:vancomycin permeability regulator SanA
MAAPPPLIAIFGAAVLRDGRPSRALMRRIGYGHVAASEHPDAPVLCSGAVGRFEPSEASLMVRALTARGVAADRLIPDEASLDTLQTVIAVLRLVRRGGHPQVIVCSDRYHVPRIRLMLEALGVATVAGPSPAGAHDGSWSHRFSMMLREAVAIPYDLAIVLWLRRALINLKV